MKEKAKKLSKKIIALIVCAVIIGILVLTAIGLEIAFVVADKIECWSPDYDREDISGILSQEQLSDEDYDLLYSQTGLTKIGIDRMLARGNNGIKLILDIQNDFFTKHTVENEFFAPFVCQDKITDNVHCTYLENGDVLITSSTHISGWRTGHAGLVTNGALGSVLEANAVGSLSELGTIKYFTGRVNFMVFSPIADAETKSKVVNYALDNLTGIVYDPTVGVFSNKNSIKKTQCAHIVWYAYKQFGIDLDYNGGLVVTPHDLACSPKMQLVQVFGLDPVKLWK